MTELAAPFVCAIDQSPHESLEALHKHLQFRLKVRQEDYYTLHAPRLDRHTGEVIPFKGPAADYLRREFKDKRTMAAWFKANPAAAREWALNWLATRKVEKDLIYAPSQVELRSLPCPSMAFYEAQPEGYNALCESLGYAVRYVDHWPAEVPALDCPVIVDTREQKPLWNPDKPRPEDPPCEWGTLRTADYGLPPDRDRQVYIERKSAMDMVSTLSDRETRIGDSNLKRFTRELERVEELGGYVVMLVEQPLSDCLAYNVIPYMRQQFSKVRVTPEHIFHNLRDLLHRFPHTFQALFVANRSEAALATQSILALGRSVTSIDLQYAYDAKFARFNTQ